MLKVIYSKTALKALRKMPRPTAINIRDKIEALARNPEATPNVKKLKGSKDYRLRVGNWRVIYSVNQGILTITILKIGPRGDIYNN